MGLGLSFFISLASLVRQTPVGENGVFADSQDGRNRYATLVPAGTHVKALFLEFCVCREVLAGFACGCFFEKRATRARVVFPYQRHPYRPFEGHKSEEFNGKSCLFTCFFGDFCWPGAPQWFSLAWLFRKLCAGPWCGHLRIPKDKGLEVSGWVFFVRRRVAGRCGFSTELYCIDANEFVFKQEI
jgi:hypothetical protein